MKSLAEQIADLDDPAPRDFDPESHDAFAQSDSDDGAPRNENAGREHYETMGKSKLRRPGQPILGQQYQASAVTRGSLNAVDDEEDEDPLAPASDKDDDDPFAPTRHSSEEEEDEGSDRSSVNFEINGQRGDGDEEDEEIDSDEAFDEDDMRRFRDFKFRGSRATRIEGNAVEDSEQDATSSMNGDEDMADLDDDEFEHDEEELGDDQSTSRLNFPQLAVPSAGNIQTNP
ncbi:MAG: hypothetical protein Q9227_005008 [Pyrenula ochraceoflavens]